MTKHLKTYPGPNNGKIFLALASFVHGQILTKNPVGSSMWKYSLGLRIIGINKVVEMEKLIQGFLFSQK